MVPPLIALEEHFLSTAVLDAFDEQYQEQFKYLPGVKDKLKDLDVVRLNDMDKGRISLQILSHAAAPGGSPEMCRKGNDELADAVRRHTDRFAGFAVLPVGDPEESAKELERCIKQLGFVGALVDNHVGGQFFDDLRYDVMWRKAEELDVAIYLHPTWPTEDMLDTLYRGNFSEGATRSLGASGWGWHSETAIHVLRLYAAGVFDRFPRLKIIVGHFGEMLPFMLQRVSNLSIRWGDQHRKLLQVWEENIWITTSGVWSLDPLRCILGNTKIDHILFSVDYPFERNENGLKWMEELEESGLVSEEELKMIAYKNAEKLFNLKAPQMSNGVH